MNSPSRVVADSFLKETIRMTSGVFMVRIVMEDTSFTMPNGQTYRCRKGDGVAMYPPTIHMDPEIFEEPQVCIAFLMIKHGSGGGGAVDFARL